MCTGQDSASYTINKYDSLGRRTGMWIEVGDFIEDARLYYKKGQKNGIYMGKNAVSPGELYGQFKNNVPVGKWIVYFYSQIDQLGRESAVIVELYDFKINRRYLGETYYDCKVRRYYADGKIENDEEDLLSYPSEYAARFIIPFL